MWTWGRSSSFGLGPESCGTCLQGNLWDLELPGHRGICPHVQNLNLWDGGLKSYLVGRRQTLSTCEQQVLVKYFFFNAGGAVRHLPRKQTQTQT